MVMKGKINLTTSHLGSSRNLNRSVNEGLIKMVKFPKKLSLRALKRSRIPGKKLQLHKHGNNFKVNDDSYELL